MNKKYQETEFSVGWGIENAVEHLLMFKKAGILMCGSFNGRMLYSDTVTMDSAYLEITGKTKQEFDKAQEERRETYIREEKEFQDHIPQLCKDFMLRGREVLTEDKWKYWDEIVPIRLKDLYHGMELGNTLDIILSLNEGDFDKAKEKFNEQGHSGMSASLVFVMVEEFSDKGKEFRKFMSK